MADPDPLLTDVLASGREAEAALAAEGPEALPLALAAVGRRAHQLDALLGGPDAVAPERLREIQEQTEALEARIRERMAEVSGSLHRLTRETRAHQQYGAAGAPPRTRLDTSPRSV